MSERVKRRLAEACGRVCSPERWRVKRLTDCGDIGPGGARVLVWRTLAIVETEAEARRVCLEMDADGYDNAGWL